MRRLHRRARFHTNRVAELSRPVADHSDSDLEVGPSEYVDSHEESGHIADIINQAVHKHRLEESYSSSIDEPASSSAASAVTVTASNLRARAAAVSGPHPEASSSSEIPSSHEDVSSLQQRIASSSTAGVGPGSVISSSSSHNGNSHGFEGSRTHPGHAARSPDQHSHPLQHSRLPLKGFSPTPTAAAGPVGGISSSSSRHDSDSELQPLLQPDGQVDELLQHQQQQQMAAAAAAAEAAPMMRGGIPKSIFVLSMVSMALTSASCVFNTLLPIYMVTELKMTMRSMGMFEGKWGWVRASGPF